jgi:RNA polymerase sigma-70 factor (ECF subfamily)
MTGSVGTQPAEDADLVARALCDPQAFALLYDRYAGPIYRYCDRRLGNREAAEDATSFVFTKAFTALGSYRGGMPTGTFRSWLFAIAHNVIADGIRARREDQPLESASLITDPAPSPEDEALTADAHRSFQRLLTRLPPDQRRIIELRLSDLTGVEIAAVLGRSHDWVRQNQARAIAKLRVMVGDATAKEAVDVRR